MTYCTRCGANNPANAKYCSNCATPLDVGPGPIAPPGSSPQPPPYAYGPRPRQEECFQQKSGEDQCLGQSRVPGLVVVAIIIVLIGVFSLVNWLLQQVYSVSSTVSSGIFLVLGGVAIIVLWLALRRPRYQA